MMTGTLHGIFIRLAALLLVLAPAQTPADEAGAQSLRLCYEDENNPPYTWSGDHRRRNPEDNGVLLDLISAAADRIGLKAHFITMPWKRCIRNFRDSRVDAIFATIWVRNRDHWGRFPKKSGTVDNSRSLWLARYPIYSHRQSPLSWDGRAFQQLSFGVSAPLGYVAEHKLRESGAFSGRAYPPEEGMKLLSMQRLDGYIAEESIIDSLITDRNYQQIRKLPVPFFTAHWHVPLSDLWYQRNPDLAERFWNALREVRLESGDRLYRQYLHR